MNLPGPQKLIFASLVLLVVPLFGGDNTLRTTEELRLGNVRYTLLVGTADQQRVLRKAGDILGSKDVTLGRLVIYGSELGRQLAFREDDSHCSPQNAQHVLEFYRLFPRPAPCPEMSEVLKLGESMVLRSVDAECHFRSIVLGGKSDPLHRTIAGVAYEILALRVTRAAQTTLVRCVECADLTAYVRTNAKLSFELARQMLLDIKRITGVRDISVAVRNNSSFAHHCGFPLVYYLIDGTGPSGRAALSDSDGAKNEVFCSQLLGGRAGCHAY